MADLLFWLIVGHFLADYPLQGDTTAREKNRHSTSELQKHVPYYYWMSAHALMHGAAVAIVTHSVLLGILETLAHWAIDYGKCEKWYNIHADQAMHLGCKILWFLLVVFGYCGH